MEKLPKINPALIYNKRILLRVDLNLPTHAGKILDTTRWDVVVPVLKAILDAQPAKVSILSHFGRPSRRCDEHSMRLLLPLLQQTFPQIVFAEDAIEDTDSLVLMENARFNEGEKSCDKQLVAQYLSGIDVVVFDAFSVAHRNHASVTGIIEHAETVMFGSVFLNEKTAIDTAICGKTPRLSVVGGSKVSTKLYLIRQLLEWGTHLIVGGGIANTFLAAKGYPMGKSLVEENAIDTARQLLEEFNEKIVLPIDGIDQNGQVHQFVEGAYTVQPNDQILDIGPESINLFNTYVQVSATIIWNGPFGLIEEKPFDKGTIELATAIAQSSAMRIVGGGDSVSIINQLKMMQAYDYVSTSGGAFLSYIAHHDLPVLSTWRTHTHETC